MTGTANVGNRDNHEWLAQVRGIHFPSRDVDGEHGVGSPLFFGLRTADILYLIGREKATVAGVDGTTAAITPYRYQTFGGEVFYAFPNIGCGDVLDACITENWGNVGGSIAAFKSERRVNTISSDCTTTLCTGSGTVWLFTSTWTPGVQRSEDQLTFTAKRSVSLLLGAGSGDRARTKGRDEGYVGETAAFAPDALFLSVLQPATDTPQRHLIGPSLSNKSYLGLQYTENELSPLVWVAKHVFHLDPALVASQATTLRLHDYRFREPVNGSRSAAREADLDFQIESPKGINLTISAAHLWPGSGLRPIIRKRNWLLSSTVSLKL